MSRGRIFNIQRYSIHDGTGIRTVVFFKGCFLRCKWCCNPESQNYEIETMNGESVGYDVTAEEIITEVERDRHYYRRSGGGLTLSGGEALMQPGFAAELLKAASERGIHTSIESTAFAEYREIEKILPYLNEFLIDIKHINAVKHQEFTGRRNDIVLENAKKIAADRLAQLIVRIPVIPGFNATIEETTEIAHFAKKLPGVEEVHLLPYHPFGECKYQALGRKYPVKGINPPDDNLLESLKAAVINTTGLRCRIGG